jgi:hypothetical protein
VWYDFHAPTSPYQTFGCEKWSKPWSHQKFPGFTTGFGSYVDIALADVSLCATPQSYNEVVDEFREYLKGAATHDGMHVAFEVTPTGGGNLLWYTLNYWNYGVGRSESEAKQW